MAMLRMGMILSCPVYTGHLLAPWLMSGFSLLSNFAYTSPEHPCPDSQLLPSLDLIFHMPYYLRIFFLMSTFIASGFYRLLLVTSRFSAASHLFLNSDGTRFVPLLQHLAHCTVGCSYFCPPFMFSIRCGPLPRSYGFLYLLRCLVWCSIQAHGRYYRYFSNEWMIRNIWNLKV